LAKSGRDVKRRFHCFPKSKKEALVVYTTYNKTAFWIYTLASPIIVGLTFSWSFTFSRFTKAPRQEPLLAYTHFQMQQLTLPASAPAPGFAWPYHEEEICASCLYVYCLYMYCLYVYCLYVYRLYVNCLYVYCLYVCCLYVYCLYVYCLYVYCPYVCCTNAFQV